MIRKIAISMVLVAALSGSAVAQHKGFAYGYIGLAGGRDCARCSGPNVHLGGGAERVTRYGLGMGGEAGYLQDSPDGFGTVSINASYHFKMSSARLVPFVTAGGSAIFKDVFKGFEGSFYEGGFNVGGGANYWVRDNVGVRLESRNYKIVGRNIYGFRIGVTFR